jgi:hypothetical protein
MVIFLIAMIGSLSIIIGRITLSKWFNHISVYAASWMMMLIFYDLKLLNYDDLIGYAWFIIIVAFFSFLLGSLIVTTARKIYYQNVTPYKKNLDFNFLSDGGKSLRYAIIITSIIALIGAIQNWIVLIRMFGDLKTVLIRANWIYSMRINNEIPGVIPYIASFGFAGIVLSGIYSAYKNKITAITLIPFLAIVLKSIASFGRVGMLMALVQFIGTFLFFRHALNADSTSKQKIKVLKIKTLIPVLISIILIIASATLVKAVRHTYEDFKSTKGVLRGTKEGMLISPSMYLYLSSHVGVLSEYLKEDTEKNIYWGENTFAPVYNFLAKFNLNKKISIYLKVYYIPMGTNTATYLKEIHADFGDWGVFIVPFLFGLLSTFFWFRFYETGNIYMFIGWVHIFTIIALSFFTMVTRGGDWYISLIVLLSIFPFINRSTTVKKCENKL